MATITQDMRFRLSLIKYADKYGVTKASVKYKTNRQYVYRRKRRYNGSIESLRGLSRRPHHHPNQHTPEEIKLISDMRRRNPDAGLVIFWVKPMQRGYSRSIPGLYRFLKKQGMMAVHPPNPKYVPKPYEQMGHPGQRIQVDVKFVPSACLVNSRVTGKQFFQHTAIDEYSRWRFVDVEFISCMEDILDIYETPYHPAVPVVCMDEKPYQLLGEVREPLPMRPGDTRKVDSEYIRNGTCSIFTFVEPLGGIRHVSVRAHRTAIDWADEIRQQAKARHANSYQEPDNADPFFHFSKSDHDQAKPRNAP